jgi:hypothetical protein
MKFLFLNRERKRSYEIDLAKSLQKGAAKHGDAIEIVKQPQEYSDIKEEHDGIILFGIAGPNDKLWRGCHKTKILLDKGYLHRETKWRFSVNYLHNPQIQSGNFSSARLGSIKLKPFRVQDGPIIFAGSSEKYHRFVGLEHPQKYAEKIISQIRAATHFPVIYRAKPSWKNARPIPYTTFSGPQEKLEDLLPARCLITYGSNSCIDSIKSGTPTICLGPNAGIGGTSLEDLNDLEKIKPRDEQQWLQNLSHFEYTNEEYEDIGWKFIKSLGEQYEVL